MACHSVTVEKGVVGHAREAHQVAPKFIQTSGGWVEDISMVARNNQIPQVLKVGLEQNS